MTNDDTSLKAAALAILLATLVARSVRLGLGMAAALLAVTALFAR